MLRVNLERASTQLHPQQNHIRHETGSQTNHVQTSQGIKRVTIVMEKAVQLMQGQASTWKTVSN